MLPAAEQTLFVQAGNPLLKNLHLLHSSVHSSPTCLTLPVDPSTPHTSTGSPLTCPLLEAKLAEQWADPAEHLHSASLPPVFSCHWDPSWQLPPPWV